ncbi:MAG TPA: signal peptidase II [Candidatus Hydrogenedentes bacterium]|jgi:signal peptidase II|nr:MAG: Lipoprotein signal peptidase [Candidatus Hydrogenedentes bacterium ADurb.Bin170]HNZ47920.1 signal peptidase II [Candidatus Hydrogenedentota bacterium]HOH43561.1 signal peptidase II [Candidatus Hydrogenedentota bacterium]HOM47208.1 signal peptidase II [Candidatus Hydrogenedentota bacterium]HPX85269.1 signal peptidase II [Candidatus Hydrogenedentota bacterium]
MTIKRKIIIIIAIVATVLLLDHGTKWHAIRTLKHSGNCYSFLGDMIRIQYAENKGAFLSLGAALPTATRSLIMVGVNALILGVLVAYLLLAKLIKPLPFVAFATITGGGIGNLIDRIFRDGSVVDFMNMGVQIGGYSLRTGIFNVADLAIMAGLFLVIGHELYWGIKQQSHAEGGKS